MEFFIKQNSNLPILKMDVVRDGRTLQYGQVSLELIKNK